MKKINVIVMLLCISILLISCDKKETQEPSETDLSNINDTSETTKPTVNTMPSPTEEITPISTTTPPPTEENTPTTVPSPTEENTPTTVPSPTEDNTPTLTETPDVMEKHISREQAKAYLKVIDDMVNKFGEGKIESDSEKRMIGLGVVRLIDFDNDGNYELYCAFSSEGGYYVDTERIYSFHGNTEDLILERSVSNFGTDVSPCTTLLSKDGKTYIWHQNEMATGSFVTVESNKLVVIMTYHEDLWDKVNYELNEKPCTEDELFGALSGFVMDKDLSTIEYYNSVDPSVITETDNVIQLIKDRAQLVDQKPVLQGKMFSDEELKTFKLIKSFYKDFEYSDKYTITSEDEKKMIFRKDNNLYFDTYIFMT